MNKAKKSLLFSLLSLVFALAITATSTYAWFMVNTTVTASNMQVGVKSDTTFLVISDSSTLGSALDLDLQVGAQGTIPAVLPARYTQTVTNNVVSNTEGQWQKGGGTAYNNGALNGQYVDITTDESKYMVHFTFYVGVTNTTSVAAEDLVVTDFEVLNNTANESAVFKPAVSVLLKCGDVYINYTDDNGLDGMSSANCQAKGVLKDTLAIGVGNRIDAYVYINGDNPCVTSANATTANLVAFKLKITFGCTAGTEA